MNPLNVWRALGLTGRIVVGAIAALVIGMAVWGVWRVVDAPHRAAQAKVEARTQTAYGASARAAMDVVTAASARDAKTKEEINEALDDIRALPEEHRYGATVALLCGMREYDSDPRCAQLHSTRPEGVGKGR